MATNVVRVPQNTTTLPTGEEYSSLSAANAAEGGIDYGVATQFVIDGLVTGPNVTFSGADYASSMEIKAEAGQEATGDTTVGAQTTTNTILSSVNDMIIKDVRCRMISISFGGTNQSLLRLVADGNGSLDTIVFSNTLSYTFEDLVLHNCSEGFRSTGSNDLAQAKNCTVVDATGFGFLRPRCNDTVALNTGSSAYLQIGASSANYWADDGSGSNAITEPTTTDIFADYAAGDYRVLDTSSVGAAGAGAFIVSASTGATADIDFTVPAPVFSVSASAEVPEPTAEIAYTIPAPVFSVSASAEVPEPIANIGFTVPAPIFSVTASALQPEPIADIDFTVPAPIFSVSASAELPEPTANVSFTVPAPVFSVRASASSVEITPSYDAVLMIDYKLNILII